jgi:hypothetical protein
MLFNNQSKASFDNQLLFKSLIQAYSFDVLIVSLGFSFDITGEY